MSSLRMAAVGRIWQGEIFIVAPELESGACDSAVTLDPAYVADWPGFLAHAAQIEAEEGENN